MGEEGPGAAERDGTAARGEQRDRKRETKLLCAGQGKRGNGEGARLPPFTPTTPTLGCKR